MIMKNSIEESERQKWERYYASPQTAAESEATNRFHQDFVDLVDTLLPDGGYILEAGCGAGEQSLALAATGRYRVTLLDFAENALRQARRRFEQAGLQADFILADAFQPGGPGYDLVFNAGVLEHYNLDQQAALLRGMASRSRGYVLTLVPNHRNYWYWLWRVQKAAAGRWPFGKEIPALDLAVAFETAGLCYLGRAYLGAAWTENFIAGMDGIDPDLKRLIRDVHRSGILPPEEICYLVADLGAVDEAPLPPGWRTAFGEGSTSEVTTLIAALADSLALQVAAQAEMARPDDDLATKLDSLVHLVLEDGNRLNDQIEALQEVVERKMASLAGLIERCLIQYEQTTVAEPSARTEAFFAKAASRLKEIVFRQFEAVCQLKRNYTTALLAHDQEVKTLWERVAALRSLPCREVVSRWRGLAQQILLRVGLLAPLKRLRHLYRKEIVAPCGTVKVSYRLPTALGHTAIPSSQRVFILTYTFFDFDGKTIYAGGAERYVLELARLLRERGYVPEVVQCGNGYWVRYYDDLRVTGVDVGGDATRLPDVFHGMPHQAALVIYSPFSLAVSAPPGEAELGISHGVFWDCADFQANRPAMEALHTALARLGTVVSVDTNTINWARASTAAYAEKFIYLPNFVDTEAFRPVQRERGDEMVILYPRRLYRPRGYWLVADALPEILTRYPRAVFHFVGQADSNEEAHVRELMVRYPGRVRWDTLPPEEMPRAYQEADITLIPTLHSEGTSLSCLEALASGNAVIATDVGGLTDLILSDYNGLLIEPTSEALFTAITRLLDDPDLRCELGRRGRESAQAFSLERWRARWRAVFDEYLPTRSEGRSASLPVVVFPATPGISWEGIQQRPHHLARQLAYAGIETFWGNPTHRLDSPHLLLHIIGPEERVQARRPRVLIYYPYHYAELVHFEQPFVIYDVLDDISIHATSDIDQNLPPGRRAVDYHEKLLAEADLVIVSSRPLLARIREKRPDALLIPNGVELAHFRTSRRLQLHDPPVIGFHGALADWLDIDLLANVAILRPEYRFELIGPASVDLRPLIRLPNVRLRGTVEYAEIPRHVAGFDVGILPFRLTPLTHAVRPLKVLEYLATGMPVVAVPLDEIRDWPGVLLAESPDDFAKQLDQALLLRTNLYDDVEVNAFLQSAEWSNCVRPLIEYLLQGAE